jgi:hypothetical protein
MEPNSNRRTYTYSARPTTWYGKLAFGAIALPLLVLAFFFLTVALVAGAIVALALLGRFWWLSRKLRRAREASAIDGEYTVIEPHVSAERLDKPEDWRERGDPRR